MISKSKVCFFSFFLCFVFNKYALSDSLVEIYTKCGKSDIIRCYGSFNNEVTSSIKCSNIPVVGSKTINNTTDPKDFVTHFATSIKFQLSNNVFTIVDKNNKFHKFKIDVAKKLAMDSEGTVVKVVYMRDQIIYKNKDECEKNN